MKFYNSAQIPVYNFYSFISDKDYSLLLKEEKDVSEKEKHQLDDAFLSIFYEYCYLSNDTSILDSFKKNINIEYLESKINSITSVLSIYEIHEEKRILEVLTSLGVPFNPSKPVEDQIKVAIRKVRGLRNKYNILISKTKEKEKEKHTKYNFEKKALQIELSLGLSYSIDTSVCTLSKWVSMINAIK